MSVIGIDLSLTSTGLATVLSTGELVDIHNVKSSGKKGDTREQRSARLFGLANEITDYIDRWRPNIDMVVIEAPSYGSRFGSAHDRSGLWWLVMMALDHDFGGVPVAQVSPQGRAKYGTGAGNSKKPVVYAAVKDRYTDLAPRRIRNDDEADAILLAAIGARHLGYPIEPAGLPEANLAALTGVLWPRT